MCLSTQTFKIQYNKQSHIDPRIWVDGLEICSMHSKIRFSKNDGFKTYEEFLAWFNQSYEGKIIHWTDFRYFDWYKSH